MSGRTEFGKDVRWRVRERMRESERERVGKRRESGGRGVEGWREGRKAGNIGGGGGRRWGEENEHTYVDW